MKSGKSFANFLNYLLVNPQTAKTKSKKKLILNFTTGVALKLMAINFNFRPSLKKHMKSVDGWINFSVGFVTESTSVEKAIIFHNGKVKVVGKIPENVDVTLRFNNEDVLLEMAKSTPNEMLNLILENRMVLDGNLAVLQLFNYYISLILGGFHQKKLDKSHKLDIKIRKSSVDENKPRLAKELRQRKDYRMRATNIDDEKVNFLEDPYLSKYSIKEFPRLKEFYDIHIDTIPEICTERPKLLTDWFRKNGFEKDEKGNEWFPELRQGLAFRYLMENKKPVIRKNDLLAGTTTAKEVGVTIFPDGQGTMFWGELNSSDKRVLNPCICDEETSQILHNEIFPFWAHRNFREYVRNNFDYPLCQRIDERFVAYFVWKSVGISHTIPNFKRVLEKGTLGIIKDIKNNLKEESLDKDQKNSLLSMKYSLQGINSYAEKLAIEADRSAAKENNENRKSELLKLSRICRNVPIKPAETLDEALNSIWIVWVAIHMENSNTGMSIGRLDQWLQPYFKKDIEKLKTADEKEEYIKHAIEITGCFVIRLSDHVPLLPDIANYLFGGASSTQAITVGGISPGGDDAVNDMTYIILKVTEMFPIRDANLNARFHHEINSDTYLKRLCDVNIVTSATPIMQSDKAVIESLKQHGYPEEDINDWAATGCVEPTLQGQNFSHTATILLNMVASMEMALNNGTHPLMHWNVGPETGSIEHDDFKTFEDFFNAWAIQQKFLIDQAVNLNNLYGEAHQKYRPTPLLSSLIDGCIDSGKDVLKGGAKYNSGGTSNIGLTDVTDSLLAIKQLVFDEKKVTFQELKKAIDTDFKDDAALHLMVKNKVKLFGSGDEKALEMGNRVAKVVHDCYMERTSYRGGRYAAGFWSMSQHVAYGSLSGTLPSGRLAKKAFTPGLTPSPEASKNFLDNITAVAKLDPKNLDNNIAFNVKLTPSAEDSREKTVDNMHSYVKTYFEQGGMQMQFNMVTSETLRDAMANPEEYKNLMVRISGYNAYFVTLNKEIQTELIERAEYGI
jgi:pyruvate formate-lyase/glycerol dehydratase family glycyl radical enzyme